MMMAFSIRKRKDRFYPLSEDAQALPDSRGSGLVRDLREAMSLFPELTDFVSTFAAQTLYTDQRAQLDGLLSSWAETSTMQTSIEQAEANGFTLVYMIPGQTAVDFISAEGGVSGVEEAVDPAVLEQKEVLKAEQQQVLNMIATLERFNGDHFVTINEESITTVPDCTIDVEENNAHVLAA